MTEFRPGAALRLLRATFAYIISAAVVLNPTYQAMNLVRAVYGATFPLAALLASYSQPVRADAFSDAAAAGNAAARDQLSQIRLPSANPTAQTVTINSTKPAINGTTFNLSELFQGSNSPANAALLGSGSATYGSTANLNTQSAAQQASLLDPSNSDPWSNAYKTVRGAALTHDHPNLLNDPIAVGADSVVKGLDPNNFLGGMSAACTTTTVPIGTTTTTHVPDIKECVRFNGSGSCRVTRHLETTNLTKSVLHFNGNVDHELTIRVQMRTPLAVDVAASGSAPTIASAVTAAGGSYQEVNETFHGDLSANVRLNTFSESDWPLPGPNQVISYNHVVANSGSVPNVTYDPPTAANGYILTITLYTPEPDEQWVSIDVTGTVSIVTEMAPLQEPPGCAQPAAVCGPQSVPWTSSGSILDQASTDRWACLNADDSRFFGAVEIGPGTWGPIAPLYPGEPTGPTSPVCYVAEARQFECAFPGAPAPPANTCGPLESDPQCVFKSADCLPENVDPVSGKCIWFEEVYDCGRDVVSPSLGSTVTTSCAGPVRCMGHDCVEEIPREVNPDFNNAAVAMQTAQWAQMDKVCDASGCEIFKGDGYTCKVVFFGVQDCCNTPVGVSFADYIKLVYYTWKVADRKAIGQFMTDQGMDTLASSWTSLTDPIAATISDLTDPLVNAWDSLLSRATDSLAGAESATADAIADSVGAELDSWVAETFPELGNMLVEAGVSGTGSFAELGAELMTNVVSPIMTVMMYYAIAVILIQLIWSCDPTEFELNVKKEMKLCHNLGKYCAAQAFGVCYEKRSAYCCYKSPFSRIIHEQLNEKFGLAWPEPSASPSCPGFTPEQLASVDWSLVDLSEWIEDLKLAGLMPDSSAGADTMYAAERITALPTANGVIGATGVQNAKEALDPTKVPAPQPSTASEVARQKLWGTLP